MKTNTQIKFDTIIKESFHNVLRPLGFKKKANNFYFQLEELGQIINVQKSAWGTKDEISFTINVGIFVPEYWKGLDYNESKEIPLFPTEPGCLIRKRIGVLRNQGDTWYEVKENTNENKLIEEIKNNIVDFILPYLESINTQQKLLQILETETLVMSPLGKMIFFAEIQKFDKASIEYHELLKRTIPEFLETVKGYGQKYRLE